MNPTRRDLFKGIVAISTGVAGAAATEPRLPPPEEPFWDGPVRYVEGTGGKQPLGLITNLQTPGISDRHWEMVKRIHRNREITEWQRHELLPIRERPDGNFILHRHIEQDRWWVLCGVPVPEHRSM